MTETWRDPPERRTGLTLSSAAAGDGNGSIVEHRGKPATPERPGKAAVRIGTSGYSFPDWVGNFYPEGIERGKMLDHYGRFFDTVEINSTYYRILHPRVTGLMAGKTPDGFLFSVKLHGSMTHSRDATGDQWRDYARMLEPLERSGKLEALLAQFPYSFRPGHDSLAYLEELSGRVAAEMDRGLSVEFRHRDWYDPAVLDSVCGIDPPLSLVSVDLPALGNLPPREPLFNTVGPGYIRFHGRNARTWWKGGAERYDWSYTGKELSEWLPAIETLASKTSSVFLYFNNCHAGQAVRSARLMRDLLGEGTA